MKDIKVDIEGFSLISLLQLRDEYNSFTSSEIFHQIANNIEDTIVPLAGAISKPTNDLRYEDYVRGTINGLRMFKTYLELLHQEILAKIDDLRGGEAAFPAKEDFPLEMEAGEP